MRSLKKRAHTRRGAGTEPRGTSPFCNQTEGDKSAEEKEEASEVGTKAGEGAILKPREAQHL